MTYPIPVFLKPARNTTRHGCTNRLDAVQKAAYACEPGGAVLADLVRLTGFQKAILTTTIGQYLKAGYLFKAGPLMRQRYFVSQQARDAAIPAIEKAEDERTQAKERKTEAGKARAREVLQRLIAMQAERSVKRTGDYHQAIVAAGAAGLSMPEVQQVMGVTRRAAQRPLGNLRSDGRIFFVMVGRNARYFATEAMATAGAVAMLAENKAISKALADVRREKKLAREMAKRRAEGVKPRQVKQARVRAEPKERKVREPKPPKAAKTKRESLPGHLLVLPARNPKPKKAGPVEIIIPENVKRTVCPSPPDRFAVSGPVVGGFATMRPGQYLPSDTWASRLVAA